MFNITCKFNWVIEGLIYRLQYKKYFFGICYSTWEDIWDAE